MPRILNTAVHYALLAALLAGLSACATTPATRTVSVEQAYNTASIVPVKPYKRTIFSSIDF